MRVRYQKVSGRLEPYYVCHDVAAHDAGANRASRYVDAQLMMPSAHYCFRRLGRQLIEVALAVEDEIAGRIEQANSMRLKQPERARYEAEPRPPSLHEC